MTEEKVASAMRESAIYLSPFEAEGIGMPALAAAAAGRIVAGYCGQVAKEFMLPEYCFPIDQGDVLDFAKRLETILQEYETDPSSLVAKARAHADFVARRHSSEGEARAVVSAWRQILANPRNQRPMQFPKPFDGAFKTRFDFPLTHGIRQALEPNNDERTDPGNHRKRST